MRPRLTVLSAATDRDPTRTAALRQRFAQDATGRLIRLRADLRRGVVLDDAFGLRTLAAPGPRQFAMSWDPAKVESFMAWLEEQERAGILETVRRADAAGPEPWSNMYVRSAYQRGLAEAHGRLAVLLGVEPGELAVRFNQPFHLQRVALLYTRAFDALKGVTAAMNSQMSRELALGLAAGEGPDIIARRLTKRVDAIGIVRARLIARTEVVAAHNMGALAEYEQAEQVLGEPVLVRWWTALDERVRPRHRERHGKIYRREEALPLLGEPGCRCSLIGQVGAQVSANRPLARAA